MCVSVHKKSPGIWVKMRSWQESKSILKLWSKMNIQIFEDCSTLKLNLTFWIWPGNKTSIHAMKHTCIFKLKTVWMPNQKLKSWCCLSDITRSSRKICTTKKDGELTIWHWSCNPIKLNLKKPHLWSLH